MLTPSSVKVMPTIMPSVLLYSLIIIDHSGKHPRKSVQLLMYFTFDILICFLVIVGE